MATRDKALTLEFTIENGQVTFDVKNGDGKNCEALAGVFTQDADALEMAHKPEYTQGQTVGARRRTT